MRQSMFEEPSKGSKQTTYLPCKTTESAVKITTQQMWRAIYMAHTSRNEQQTHPDTLTKCSSFIHAYIYDRDKLSKVTCLHSPIYNFLIYLINSPKFGEIYGFADALMRIIIRIINKRLLCPRLLTYKISRKNMSTNISAAHRHRQTKPAQSQKLLPQYQMNQSMPSQLWSTRSSADADKPTRCI